MICKYCNAEIGETENVCPVCGKSLAEEVSEQEQTVAETVETAEETLVEETVVENEETTEESTEEIAEDVTEEVAEEVPVQPKKKVWPLVLGIVGAVVALGILAVVLLIALDVDLKPKANDLFCKETFVVEDETATKKADAVVATIGGKELTNSGLQIYYNMQVADFVNYYGSYLSYIGLDMSKPLNEQTCALDETLNWEQYFIKVSIETWQNYQCMGLLAEENGYSLDPSIEEQIDALPENLNEQAVESGYESAAAMIQEFLGATCTVEDYLEYIRLMYLSNEYYSAEYEKATPGLPEMEDYFAEHDVELRESGVTKESGLVSDVRHILVLFEGGTTDDQGVTTYSEDEKATALAEAERILEEWKSGEATEESFAELANKYSGDPGSNTTGGLYQGIAPGSNYYENFLNWAVDATRKTGDTGIVESQSGYHIMYFVTGEEHWINTCRTALATEHVNRLIEEAEAKWPIEINYKKIALTELKIG